MADQTLTSLANGVSGPNLMGHLQEFARWVKLSGTPDELQSLRYVQAQAGRVRLSHQADHARRLYQPARRGAGRCGQPGADQHHAFVLAQSSPAGGVTRTAGLCRRRRRQPISPGRDLRGAIVLIEGIASPAAGARASRAGAVGQVQISPHEHLHEMCVSPVWGSPSAETLPDLPSDRGLHRLERRRQRRCASGWRAASSRG